MQPRSQSLPCHKSLLSLYTVTIHKGSKIIAQPVSYSLREASCACVYLVNTHPRWKQSVAYQELMVLYAVYSELCTHYKPTPSDRASLKKIAYGRLIGASLSEPHISESAVALDLPVTLQLHVTCPSDPDADRT